MGANRICALNLKQHTMKKIILIIALTCVGCKKDCIEPRKELAKSQIDSLFKTKLIMKK